MCDHVMARALGQFALGLLGGATLGVVARAWMRLISDDPEFSWGGTAAVVGGFAVWGCVQGFAMAVRRAASRRWVVIGARVVGIAGTLPLFFGAGSILAPTVLAGGLGRHRRDWKRWLRCVLGGIAAAPVIAVAVQLHSSWAWTWRWWVGMVGLVAIYGLVIEASGSTIAPKLDG